MLKAPKQGFTLLEIMIVVTIIGILVALVFPLFSKIKISSQNSALANDLRCFSSMIEFYATDSGDYPEPVESGSLPPDLSGYITSGQWNARPSIGGMWDLVYESGTIISAVGVRGFSVDDEQLRVFDEKYDDASLSTGLYRKIGGGGFFRIIAE